MEENNFRLADTGAKEVEDVELKIVVFLIVLGERLSIARVSLRHVSVFCLFFHTRASSEIWSVTSVHRSLWFLGDSILGRPTLRAVI